jgi:hypothetical protein
MPLLHSQPGEAQMKVADLRVSSLQGDIVAAVYRDVTDGNKGFVVLGRAAPEGMQWHAPVLFSNQSQAYSPVLVQLSEDEHGTQNGGIAIAFRTASRGGDGILLGGHISPTSGKIAFGIPKAFARHQAQAMQLISLPDSRVVVIFAEHLFQGQAGEVEGGAMYGAALLTRVHSNGATPEILSKDRFAIGPIARLNVVALSPTSFGIGYRQGGAEAGSHFAEAACIVGELHGEHIRFNSEAVLLEPTRSNIWARSLSLVGKNTMAYTYYSADERKTKQAILHADPKSHRLVVTHGPVVLSSEFSPVIGSASFVQEEPSTHDSLLLTVLSHDEAKPAEAQFCKISEGKPSGCRPLSWNARNLVTVSATAVSGDRIVLVTTDHQGTPHYQVTGMAT